MLLDVRVPVTLPVILPVISPTKPLLETTGPVKVVVPVEHDAKGVGLGRVGEAVGIDLKAKFLGAPVGQFHGVVVLGESLAPTAIIGALLVMALCSEPRRPG